jgi:hypothetical protein
LRRSGVEQRAPEERKGKYKDKGEVLMNSSWEKKRAVSIWVKIEDGIVVRIGLGLG